MMEKRFSRVLLGYEPAIVENKIANAKDENMITLRYLEKELIELDNEIEELQNRKAMIRGEITLIHSVKDQITQILLSTHLENTERVYMAMKKGEQMGREARESVFLRRQEKDRLNKELKRLTEEMQSIASDYKLALEAFQNG